MALFTAGIGFIGAAAADIDDRDYGHATGYVIFSAIQFAFAYLNARQAKT